MLRAGQITAVALILAGCGLEEPQVDGRAFFAANCASCHGTEGRGDGPLAPRLAPPPADLTHIAARNGGVFPTVEVMSVIDGYARGDRAMPAFGEAALGPLINVELEPGVGTPIPATLWALAGYLDSIQEPAMSP